MATIEIDALRKSYGATPVVKGLSLSIGAGEFVSLLGPSGCGKTTTLRILAGLEHADGGTVRIGGQLVEGDGVRMAPEHRGLGMVFQSYAIWPHKSVSENVAYPLRLRRLPKADIAAKVREALRWVRLEALAERRPHAMSGGQLQRVAIARALVADPKVLLLDEPLSNLDLALREELRAELAALRSRLGTTMVYVTHDQGEALALSDRVAVMRGGVIEQVDAPERLYREPANPFVAGFVGGANVLEGERVDGGFDVHGIRFRIDAADGHRGPATLVVRPEDATIDPSGTPLPLSARLFLGHATEYRFELGDGLLRVLGPSVDARVGDHVPVLFRAVRLFPKTSTAALAA